MNCQPLVSETALDGIKEWPIRYELDSPKSLDEVISAIRLLKNNKSPGEDSIPAEVLKCGIHILGPLLHNIFLNIWEKKSLPIDFKNTLIVKIFKKGDKSDCGNYRGISLLSTAGKVFTTILLRRLHPIVEEILPETQGSF